MTVVYVGPHPIHGHGPRHAHPTPETRRRLGMLTIFKQGLDSLEHLQPVFNVIDITESQFISDLRQFHTLELVDLCHDKAAKISDQSFSNYLETV